MKLDSRFIKNTDIYLHGSVQPYTEPAITNDVLPTTYLSLEPFEVYTSSLTNQTLVNTSKIYLPIDVSNFGIYEIHYLVYGFSSDLIANFDFTLRPNYTYYANAPRIVTELHFATIYTPQIFCRTTPVVYPIFWCDPQAGGSDTPPFYAYMIADIKNKQLTCLCTDTEGTTLANTWWTDTTTPWTKLGYCNFTNMRDTTTGNPGTLNNVDIHVTVIRRQ